MLPRLCSYALAFGVALGPIAAQEQPSNASFLRAEDYRVARIGFRIGREAARFCPDLIPLSGLQLQHLAEYAPQDRPGVIVRRRLDRGPGALSIIENSPAALAGFQAGDVVLSINGLSLRPPAPELSAAEGIRARTRALLEQQLGSGAAEVRILRDGGERSLSMTAVRGCPARVRLARSREPIAVAADGEVVVTTALLDAVRSDDELAAIIGHEVAHVALRHADRLRAQKVPAGALREFGKNAARVRATEEEADRLGIRLGWAAGYDMNAAIPFWRRYYARYDGPRLFRTHPTLKARERLIRETIAELQAGAQRPEFGKGALGQR